MTKEFDFEKGMKELESITEWFEQPDVDLDLSLAKFERGLELSNELKDYLQKVENKVEKIKKRFDTPVRDLPIEHNIESDDQTDLLA